MRQFQLSPSKMDALLAMAGKKMGADPKKLKQQMQDGRSDALLDALPQDKREQISALIQNPQAMEQFIQNPKVQQLLQGLMGR